MDRAGRLVIPAPLRSRIGLDAGSVDIEIDGNGLRIAPVPAGSLREQDGLLVVSGDAEAPTTEEIRKLRLADQR